MALESDALPRAVVADPRAVAARWPEERPRVIAQLAVLVAEQPWALSTEHHERARTAGISDEELLQVTVLAAFFGHLNRIADAVAVPLDYPVRNEPPRAEPATPALQPAPRPISGRPGLDLATLRPVTATALAAWRSYVMEREEVTVTLRQRALISRRVGALLGLVVVEDSVPQSGVDNALLTLAAQVTLAPWQLGDTSYQPLREAGYSDAALFDAVMVASTAGVAARIEVALAALAGQSTSGGSANP